MTFISMLDDTEVEFTKNGEKLDISEKYRFSRIVGLSDNVVSDGHCENILYCYCSGKLTWKRSKGFELN